MKLIMRSSYRHSTTLAGSKMRANCMWGKIIGQAFLAAKAYHINIPFSTTIKGNDYARSWKLHRQSSSYHLVLPPELRMKKDGSVTIREKITKKDEKALLKRTDVLFAKNVPIEKIIPERISPKT